MCFVIQVEEEVSNEMERVSVNGQQEEVKLEPKVSKAQRRRVSRSFSNRGNNLLFSTHKCVKVH